MTITNFLGKSGEKDFTKLLRLLEKCRQVDEDMLARCKTLNREAQAVSAAATELGHRPKKPDNRWRKKPVHYTGMSRGKRFLVGQLVRTKDGCQAFVLQVNAGSARVILFSDDGQIKYCAKRLASTLTPCGMPEARLLGAQKRGVKEAPSQRKAESSRRNGCCPPKPGSRPRGRPRKNIPVSQQNAEENEEFKQFLTESPPSTLEICALLMDILEKMPRKGDALSTIEHITSPAMSEPNNPAPEQELTNLEHDLVLEETPSSVSMPEPQKAVVPAVQITASGVG